MNFTQLCTAIQTYTENTFSTNQLATFIQQTESRVYNLVQFPSLRKNSTGNLTIGNQYLSLPNDFLSVFSLAVIDSSGTYTYLLNKDVNFIREAFPTNSVAARGLPNYYALFGPQYVLPNELSCIVGPTPDQSYTLELHYFYYPASIVQGIITGVGTITAGSGYSTGTYYNIPITGGSGSYATADITVVSGAVTSFTINNGGQYFVVGDTISFSAISVGAGTGGGFSTTVVSVNNSTGTSWLGDNFDPVLLYGSLVEAITYMKGDADLVTLYGQKFQEAVLLVKQLGDGKERGDAYRDGQLKINISNKGPQ
jgi:hypothetical protein